MRRSVIRIVVATVAALATTLGLGVGLAGTANAAAAWRPPVRVHTTLSIVESRNVIRPDRDVVITGRLAAGREGLSGKLVLLDRIEFGRAFPVRAKLTFRNGSVSFVANPDITAHYELIFLGTRLFAPTHSGVVTVHVRR